MNVDHNITVIGFLECVKLTFSYQSFQHSFFYTPINRRDVLWNGPVRPSVCLSVRPFKIACERDILKTACRIDFTF